MRFFLIAAVLNPTAKQVEEGHQALIVLAPEFVLAKNQNQAMMKIASKIGEKYWDDDRLDITIFELVTSYGTVGNSINKADWKALVK